jgi:hypothetical protein
MDCQQGASCQRPEADEVRELFARFGRAYYYAEVLSRGLLNLCALSKLPKEGPITRPRAEEHLREAFRLTLGQAVTSVSSYFTPENLEQLKTAVQQRNFLAHHFWFECAHLLTSKEGVKEMIFQLDLLADLFQRLDKEVECVSRRVLARIGITETMLVQCFDEVLRGEPMEPLPKTRMPKKEEVIIGVFRAVSPTTPGKSVLLFQTDDGLIWQLCDAGLGWSPYETVDANWEKVDKFVDLLPARVNPRPPLRGPWNFDIVFGKQARLEVRPGVRPGEVIFKLNRTSSERRSR